MRILLIEPQRPPKEIDLAPGLKSLQAAVGGPIQPVRQKSLCTMKITGEHNKYRTRL